MQRRRKVPGQSSPAAVLAAIVYPSIVVGGVCAHATALIVANATIVPMLNRSNVITNPLLLKEGMARSAGVVCSSHTKSLTTPPARGGSQAPLLQKEGMCVLLYLIPLQAQASGAVTDLIDFCICEVCKSKKQVRGRFFVFDRDVAIPF